MKGWGVWAILSTGPELCGTFFLRSSAERRASLLEFGPDVPDEYGRSGPDSNPQGIRYKVRRLLEWDGSR